MLNSKSFMLSMFLTASFFSMTTYASSLNQDDSENENTAKKSTQVAQRDPSNTSVIDCMIDCIMALFNTFTISLPSSESTFDADQTEEKNAKKPHMMDAVLPIHQLAQDEIGVIASFMSLEDLYRARRISKFFHKIMHMEIPKRTFYITWDFSKHSSHQKIMHMEIPKRTFYIKWAFSKHSRHSIINFNPTLDVEAFHQSVLKHKVLHNNISLTVKNLDENDFKDTPLRETIKKTINSVQELVYYHNQGWEIDPNTIKILQLDPYEKPEDKFARISLTPYILKIILIQYKSMEIFKITGYQFADFMNLDVPAIGFSLPYITEINNYNANKLHLPGTGILTQNKTTLQLIMRRAPKSLKTFYFVPDFVGRENDTQPIIDFADSIKMTNIREIHVPFFCAKKVPSNTTAGAIKRYKKEYDANLQVLQQSLSDADPAKNIRLIIEPLENLVHPTPSDLSHYDSLKERLKWDQD